MLTLVHWSSDVAPFVVAAHLVEPVPRAIGNISVGLDLHPPNCRNTHKASNLESLHPPRNESTIVCNYPTTNAATLTKVRQTHFSQAHQLQCRLRFRGPRFFTSLLPDYMGRKRFAASFLVQARMLRVILSAFQQPFLGRHGGFLLGVLRVKRKAGTSPTLLDMSNGTL